MGPHGTFQLVGDKTGLSKEGPQQCSRASNTARSSSSSGDISREPLPVTSDAQSSTCSGARRNKVYVNIMRQWEKAASSMLPMPRSSHRRVLGGQALPTRQRGESFSLETRGSSVKPSWGNLSDTVSPTVQLAWREQLLRLKLSRLAGLPMTVLFRHQEVRGGPGGGAPEACRMVVASQDLSAELTALAVIEGTYPDVPLNASSSLSRAAAGGPAESVRGSGGGRGNDCEAAEQQQQQPQPQRHKDEATVNREESEKVVGGEQQDGVVSEHSCASSPAVSMSSSSSSSISSSSGRGRATAPPLPAKPPVRGFHLVDLHAVVRNSVEWRQCLPKVEPCFRVSSNRDSVLLGLVHALGGRLSCSSAHDITAGAGAARHASPVPAPPPRLLDRHVCRSPALLRASVAAGVQLYEVDSADEWGRIGAARRRQELSNQARSRDEAVGAAVPHPQTTGVGPASVVVRLAMPFFRSTRHEPDGSAAASTVADFSGAVEASYGAREEDVVEIVQTAMADTTGPEYGGGEKHSISTSTSLSSSSSGGGGGSSSPLPIVGFSIDLGPVCWGDALAGHASVPPPFVQRRSDASCAALDAATDATGLAPGGGVPSASLSESIDAAVAFAVKMAGVAAAAVASTASSTSTTPPLEGETSKQREKEALGVANGTGASGSATTTTTTTATTAAATLCSLASSPSPFSFRRLHVTGLGEGGARGEPLAALTTALSKHLPPTVATAVTASSGDSNGGGGRDASRSSTPVGRPVVVSADATEHLVTGGVWSTVASIIGRKSVPPAAVDDERSLVAQSPTKYGIVGGSAGSHGVADTGAGGCCAGGEGVGEGASTLAGASAGGAMYYIDDGCYGSLSGALLRGVQMQPLPLRVTAAGETSHSCRDDEGSTEPAQELPCTVWGPTCDGLDCVCRMTPLPDDMEPGRDWLFFPDVGIRGGADATDFNGLKPLDLFYCVRQRIAPSRTTAPALPPRVTRPVFP